jgi:hypothetical protein
LKPSAIHIAFLVQASLLLPLMTFGRGFVQNIYEFHVSHSKLLLLALLPSFCFHFTTFSRGTLIATSSLFPFKIILSVFVPVTESEVKSEVKTEKGRLGWENICLFGDSGGTEVLCAQHSTIYIDQPPLKMGRTNTTYSELLFHFLRVSMLTNIHYVSENILILLQDLVS